jgi:hypothetical protein
MKTIETTAVVAPDGQLILQLQAPPGMEPGRYSVVLVVEEREPSPEIKKERPPLDFPVRSWGPWPEELSLKRADMHGDRMGDD